VNPALGIEDVPRGAKSLALIVDDPDAPKGTFVHWLLWNIDPETREIEEDSALNSKLDLKGNARKADLEKAMKGHVLEEAALIGLYSKKELVRR